MSLYCIGDLQGCAAPFRRLLDKIDFSPSRDTLYLLGDLVNRGPDSLGVLQTVMALGNAAHSLLGNHDLHLLAVAHGVRKAGAKDTLQAVLQAPERAQLLDWLRHQHVAMTRDGWLMVHAGVLPGWTVMQTLALASEVESALRSPDYAQSLAMLFGNAPARWDDALTGPARLRVIVNALTRLRFCTADGEMEFTGKAGASSGPLGYLPWFDEPGRATADTPIAFGHWSALVADHPAGTDAAMHNHALPLDTGCVWGNCLSAARLGAQAGDFELINVTCDDQARFKTSD